jgi:uncharacterized protein
VAASEKGAPSSAGIHLMAKPTGPRCNLACDYCFYLEKDALFKEDENFRMSDEVLEAYVRSLAIANRDVPAETIFAWQGGEPTLLGLDFFARAVDLEEKYMQGRPFRNTIQTNGTMLNGQWCEFLASNKFLVGLSLDGPESVHDFYRKDGRGKPTFSKVMAGLKLLQQHGVEYNVLACVAAETAKHPLEVYNFFKEQGVQFIQLTAGISATTRSDNTLHLTTLSHHRLENRKFSLSGDIGKVPNLQPKA